MEIKDQWVKKVAHSLVLSGENVTIRKKAVPNVHFLVAKSEDHARALGLDLYESRFVDWEGHRFYFAKIK